MNRYLTQRLIAARWLLVAGTACAGAILIAACSGPSGVAGSSSGSTEITVRASEFKLDPRALNVTAGNRVRLTFVNEGLLEHDWEAKDFRADEVRVVSSPPGLGAAASSLVRDQAAAGVPHPSAPPHGRMVIEFTPMTPGTFEVACQVPGHKEAGMVATLNDASPAADALSQARPLSVTSPQSASHEAHVLPSSGVATRLAQPLVAPSLEPVAATFRHVDIETREVTALLDDGVEYHFWTFGGTVPGPMIRVHQGDTVELTLHNAADSTVTHSIDLHAVTGPGGGAVASQVAPGQSATFQFQALNPGVYVYHCATPIAPVHIANGMYGLIVVEPPEGLPPVDHELYVMQGDYYLEGARGEPGLHSFSMEKMLDERPDYVVFNGSAGSRTGDQSFHARVGETLRIFFGVGGPNLHSSFHVIGEIFDLVHPEGAAQTLTNVQTTVVPPGGATMVEFTTQVPGSYTLVDHSLGRVVKGTAATLVVEGADNLTVFDPRRSAAELAPAGH